MKKPISARDKYLLRTYGITQEKYEELLEQQGQSCKVCGKHRSLEKRALSVDHDHRTREIYGILCNFCNSRLIGRIRNPVLFERAAEYLRKGTGLFTPIKKKRKRKKKK